ncbi:MAG TPA: hypothetical protein VLR92_00405 [Blastocatellia bacterium]|nr:hypothetical protein [Blastocatellia bacterium]
MTKLFSEYPSQVRASTQRPGARFVRRPGYYAEHGRLQNMPARGAELVLNDGRIAVFQGEPAVEKRDSPPITLSPIYELQPGGSPAVPTGLIFIRLREGVDVASRRQEIERRGYEIAQTVPYASNAAWLRATSASIADALAGIAKLEALPDIENVEPQMLMESVPKR